MNCEAAFQLVSRYVGGWINQDTDAILGILDDNCAIIESHGPSYHGKAHVSGWLKGWKDSGSTVTKWDILSFVSSGQEAAFEWDFECMTHGNTYKIKGMSRVSFMDGKISLIHEYRMTGEPYIAPAVYE